MVFEVIFMKLLLSVQYPVAIIELPNRLDKDLLNIKEELYKWIDKKVCLNVTDNAELLEIIIEYLKKHLEYGEQMNYILLDDIDDEIYQFPKKYIIYI